jgi:hypothetical protein
MYQTYTSSGIQPFDANERVEASLNWLLEVNQWEANQQRIFRSTLEEEEMLLLRRPLPMRQAYALFGLLLGTCPPAAIFIKACGYGIAMGQRDSSGAIALCLVMNVICAFVGGWAGSALARKIGELERDSWIKMLIFSPLMGLAWAIPTGAAGGAIVFLIGSIFGAIVAMPVGLLAFVMFMPLHRLLARGGMIDARHFWPLACGVVMFISALILGI